MSDLIFLMFSLGIIWWIRVVAGEVFSRWALALHGAWAQVTLPTSALFCLCLCLVACLFPCPGHCQCPCPCPYFLSLSLPLSLALSLALVFACPRLCPSLVLPCLALPCLALPCLALPRLALPCPALPPLLDSDWSFVSLYRDWRIYDALTGVFQWRFLSDVC